MGRNDLENYLQPILADGKVRYVGEPIAVIFATENHIADRAAELLDVNIQVMKPQISATENPLTFSGHLNNEACLVTKKYGDVDKVCKITTTFRIRILCWKTQWSAVRNKRIINIF